MKASNLCKINLKEKKSKMPSTKAQVVEIKQNILFLNNWYAPLGGGGGWIFLLLIRGGGISSTPGQEGPGFFSTIGREGWSFFRISHELFWTSFKQGGKFWQKFGISNF